MYVCMYVCIEFNSYLLKRWWVDGGCNYEGLGCFYFSFFLLQAFDLYFRLTCSYVYVLFSCL